jgi:hypothetical protein
MTLLIPKRQIIRDPAYRRYVASLPCMACKIPHVSILRLVVGKKFRLISRDLTISCGAHRGHLLDGTS